MYESEEIIEEDIRFVFVIFECCCGFSKKRYMLVNGFLLY